MEHYGKIIGRISAINATTLKVTFNKPVDTKKAAFVVKNAYLPVDVKAQFAEDAKSVTLTAENNFIAGDYTVTVKGLTETDLVSSLKIDAQKLASFTIKTTQLLAKPGAQDFIYEAVDQYGEAFNYASSNFYTTAYNVTTPANTATVSLNGNKMSVTLKNPTAKDNIVITLVDKATGISQTQTITVVPNAAVNTVSLGQAVPKKDNDRIFKNEVAGDKVYIPVSLKDQYGNEIAIANSLIGAGKDITIISSDSAIVDPSNITSMDSNNDGVNDALNIVTGNKAGSVTLTLIVNKTGNTKSVSFTVYDPAALGSVSFVQPEELFVAKEPITVNYTAADTFGKAVKLANVKDLSWFSTNTSVVDTAKDIAVDAKGVLTITPQAKGTTVISAFLKGAKQGEISLSVNDAAVETRITKVLPTALTCFAKNGGTYTYTVKDFEIIDQYNRVIKSPKGSVTVAVKDKSADTVATTGAAITAANNKLGSKVITLTYTNGAVSLTKEFTVNVIDNTAIAGYELAPIENTVLYAGGFTDAAAAGSYASQFAISNGLDASGNKVALSADEAKEMTLTNTSSDVTIDPATNKVFAAGKTDKGAATVAAWKNGKKIAEVHFTTSNVAPALTTLKYAKDSYTVAPKAMLDLSHELTVNGSVLDQYGVKFTPLAGTWFSNDNAIATVNSTTGKVTGVKAGETTIIFVAPNGVNISVKVIVE